MKENVYYPSKDGITKIHAIIWKTQEKPKAILQICHGMQEYIGRYEPFAEFLSSNGICVCGEDHLGHGESVVSDEKLGYFAAENGNNIMLEDINELRKMVHDEFTDVPYFVLGHSMGSFLARQYIQRYGNELTGAIIMGTGTQPGIVLAVAKSLCKIISAFKGWEYRSKFVNKLAIGAYNKKFEPARTTTDWLTRDEKIVDAYLKDPWCTFTFTLNAYYNMFLSIGEAQSKKLTEQIPKELPLLVVSGKEDPVGGCGKGVEQAFNQYKNAGIKDVQMKLYKDARHEILNEIGKEETYNDILKWLKERAHI